MKLDLDEEEVDLLRHILKDALRELRKARRAHKAARGDKTEAFKRATKVIARIRGLAARLG